MMKVDFTEIVAGKFLVRREYIEKRGLNKDKNLACQPPFPANDGGFECGNDTRERRKT